MVIRMNRYHKKFLAENNEKYEKTKTSISYSETYSFSEKLSFFISL